jgi:putative FmdB family regulatory protein
MPTYEYQCPECGPFDKVVSLSDYDDMKYVTCR